MKDAEHQAELDSITKIEAFKSHLKHVMRICEAEENAGESDFFDDHEAKLLELVDVLEDDLITIEMNMQQNLTASIELFRKRLNEITEQMKGSTSFFIGKINEAIEKFFGEFKEAATKTMEQYAKMFEKEGEEDLDIEGELGNDVLNFLDPEPLKQALDSSREAIDGRVAGIETDISVRLNQDKDEIMGKTQDEQYHRNRNIIREIIHQSKTLKDQIEDDFRRLRGEDDWLNSFKQ